MVHRIVRPLARLRVAVLALAVASVAVAASSQGPDHVPDHVPGAGTAASGTVPHALKIVAFGSSSTQGIGASGPAAAYPAQLESMLRAAMPEGRVDVVNRGVGGEDVDDMMVRLDRDVLAARPAIAIWQTGSNDALRHVPLERFERETRAGISAMRRAGIAVVLMEPQWCPALEETGDAFRDVVRAVGAEMGVPVIRRSDLMHDWIRSGLLTPTDMLAPDGLHMRDAGYRLLAGRVAAEVLHMAAVRNGAGARITTAGL